MTLPVQASVSQNRTVSVRLPSPAIPTTDRRVRGVCRGLTRARSGIEISASVSSRECKDEILARARIISSKWLFAVVAENRIAARAIREQCRLFNLPVRTGRINDRFIVLKGPLISVPMW